jgi:hypothetical protein
LEHDGRVNPLADLLPPTTNAIIGISLFTQPTAAQVALIVAREAMDALYVLKERLRG